MTNYTQVAYKSTDVPEADEVPTPQEVIEQVDDLALEIERQRKEEE